MNIIGTAQEWLPPRLLARMEHVAGALVSPGEALLARVCRHWTCLVHGCTFGVNIALKMCGLHGAAIATASVMVMDTFFLHIGVRRRLGTTLFASVGGGRYTARACEGVH